MKKSFFILFFLLSAFMGWSQQPLLVQSNAKGLYLTHTVSAKEGFYAIGRLYNIHPKEIAEFNSIDLNSGLSIGQTIQIPLTATNFTQTTNSGTPVYYVVGEKEGLYRVSLKNNNVLMVNLRKWNNLATDNINTGQKLIVGFVTTNGEITTTTAAVTPKAEPEPVKVEPKQTQPEPVKTEPVKPAQQVTPQVAVKDANGGYFKPAFESQSRANNANKDQTATAGIFKTASGWQDAKYYALMDGVDPGTIVRVINPNNSKAIYAKVLGAMSGINQNKGLDVRISNAAANVLEIGDTEKFVVRVSY